LVLRELREARKCIVRRDNDCTLRHLELARRLEKSCNMCREEMGIFRKQLKKLSYKDRVKKVDLLIKVSKPAAYVAPRMRELRSIKPSWRLSVSSLSDVGSRISDIGSKLGGLVTRLKFW